MLSYRLIFGLQGSDVDFISHDIEDLSPDTLSNIKTPYNYRCYVVGNQERKRWYLLGCGVCSFHCLLSLLPLLFLVKTNVNFRGRMYLNGMEILNRGGGSWMRYESNYRRTHWSRWRSFRRWKARYFRVYVSHVKPENIIRYFNITFMWEKKLGWADF